MKSKGGAVSVRGEHAQLDPIFGFADRVRFRGFLVGHRRSHCYVEDTVSMIDGLQSNAIMIGILPIAGRRMHVRFEQGAHRNGLSARG
jgi:hypothetical protein